jgi:hypothetical protein
MCLLHEAEVAAHDKVVRRVFACVGPAHASMSNACRDVYQNSLIVHRDIYQDSLSDHRDTPDS